MTEPTPPSPDSIPTAGGGARRPDAPIRFGLSLLLFLLVATGCRSTPKDSSDKPTVPILTLPSLESTAESIPVSPSLDRDWVPQHARLPRVELDGARVKVYDVRNFDYITETDFVPRFEKRTYDLRDLESVDYIVIPFPAAPLMAHTMLSFGFGRGQYLVSSAEVRLEKGETYSPLLGAMWQYELMYVLADEKDAVRLRADVRGNDVFVYRVQAPPDKVRELFLDVVERVNQLHEEPEFYDTLTNNCTTNISRHVNRIAANRIPYGTEVLLPGLSGQLAYNLGLLDRSVPYEQLMQRSNVAARARQYRDAPDFSVRIRR